MQWRYVGRKENSRYTEQADVQLNPGTDVKSNKSGLRNVDTEKEPGTQAGTSSRN